MANRSRTPIFSFEASTPSRENHSALRPPSARDILNRITSGETNSGSATHSPRTPLANSTQEHVDNQDVTPRSRDGDSGYGFSTAIKNFRSPLLGWKRCLLSLQKHQKKRVEGQGDYVIIIPRALSAVVRDAYSRLVDEDGLEWNFMASFGDDSNKELNRKIIQNVQAVSHDHNITLIKRAVRVYFKSKKSLYKRKQSGKQDANAAMSRRRQRRHNKARARLRVLNVSKALDDTTKQKIRPVLKAEFMSSEESTIEETPDDREHSSGSDIEEVRPLRGRKSLIKHKLPWRSQEMQSIIDRLDRKLDRRRDDRAKGMCLQTSIGSDSKRPKPDHLPEWATELFS